MKILDIVRWQVIVPTTAGWELRGCKGTSRTIVSRRGPFQGRLMARWGACKGPADKCWISKATFMTT